MTLTTNELKTAFVGVADHIEAHKQELSELDALAGDGDLGVTLSKGFAEVRIALEPENVQDVGRLLDLVGTTLLRKAPSTIGTLLGSCFRAASGTVGEEPEVGRETIVVMLRACAESVATRGRVGPGDRTVLDAMLGSVEAAQSTPEGTEAVAVLVAAAEGARRGADATAFMDPKVGRAGWVGERAKGHRDAGAVAWHEILVALGCSSRTRPEQ